MFPQLGPPIGFLIATGLFLLLLVGFGEAAFVAWAWRVPFLLSAVLVAIGLYVRVSLEETPAFKALEQEKRADVPLTTILRDHLPPLIQGSLAIVVCYALFYISTVYALGYGVRALGIPAHDLSRFAVRGDRLHGARDPALRRARRPVRPPAGAAVSAVAAIAVGLAMPALMAAGMVGVFVFLALALGVMGLTFAPLGALLPELFPFPSATRARRARTISAASSAPPSRRRWRSRSSCAASVRAWPAPARRFRRSSATAH